MLEGLLLLLWGFLDILNKLLYIIMKNKRYILIFDLKYKCYVFINISRLRVAVRELG